MSYDENTPLLGQGVTSAAQIQAWFVAHTPDVPLDLGDAIVAVAAQSGLNADFLAAEIACEAAFGDSPRFREARNPSGLGATDDGAWGAVFPDIRAGIIATAAHWLTEIYGAANTWAALDPRYDALISTGYAGTIRTIGQIGSGVWASDPHYASTCLRLMGELLAFAGVDAPAPAAPTAVVAGGRWPTLDELGILDIRDRMTKAPGQGAGYKQAKRGVVIHYNGPPTHDPAFDRFISDSGFHVGPYLREYTIAYIYGIGDEPGDGTDAPIYLMRDPDDVCWHCGSWPQNATHTPIAFTFGEGQAAGPGQLRSAVKLIKALQERDGFGDEAVKGHKEVDSTSCPGTLMDDLIYPFRDGKWTNGGYTPMSDRVQFAETGHGIEGPIRRYFEHNGGVVVFGYPLSEVVDDPEGRTNPDGTPMRVQFFEANVLEIHPENPAPSDVLRRRLGAKEAVALGMSGTGVQYP